MPTELQISNTVLSAQLKMSVLVNDNYNRINNGNVQQNLGVILFLRLNAIALQFLLNFGFLDTETTLIIYDRLNRFLGFWTASNTLDPYAQLPNTVLEIVNPGATIPGGPLPYAQFDSSSTQPDTGRTQYSNTSWKGLNPIMALASPAMTYLVLGVDYSVLVSGGFVLLPSGNKPEIYPGEDFVIMGFIPIG